MNQSDQDALKVEAVQAEEIDIKRWVMPFYLDFLHGNFKTTKGTYSVASPHQRSWDEWRTLLRRELREITPQIAGDLIMDGDWRTQICGAYFCGFKRWDDFTLDIGNRLVAKRNSFATQGYAFALARMPSHASANYLCGYLSRVGRPQDTTNWYGVDMEWVIGALGWVDAQMNTNRLEPYLEKLIPFQQKQRYEGLKKWYQEAPSLILQTEDPKSEAVERELLRIEKELDLYFSPEDTNWQRPDFGELMAFCEFHFDAPD
jgi:hypothetical protein